MRGARGVTRARQLRPLRLWPRRPRGDGSIMASMQKRLQKELLALQNDPPPGMTLNEKSVQNSITQWIVDMEGAPGTLYEGEKFQLLFKFSSRYPFDSPQRRPPDNSFYVRTCNKNPKKTKWWYHAFSDLVCVHTEPQARTRCRWLYPAEKVSSLTGTFFIFKLIPKMSFSYLPCHHGVLCN
ncbi:ubiquitin-conjugating enzyme E2 W isoform X3 [Pteropus medius]|uniref:ubiquitin-conjugating enzyme E2 W isoform X3 n=1 Tax=Pteropus vampyrus TaxID=132908 RepID=UPI00196AECEC|nr:ubiquitin-conjugating enzyme E2 W isoform X3 [Pteropus giganteus]